MGSLHILLVLLPEGKVQSGGDEMLRGVSDAVQFISNWRQKRWNPVKLGGCFLKF